MPFFKELSRKYLKIIKPNFFGKIRFHTFWRKKISLKCNLRRFVLKCQIYIHTRTHTHTHTHIQTHTHTHTHTHTYIHGCSYY